jgi:cytochrome c peroxidase
VPGRVIPNDPEIEAAVLLGERKFEEIGCAGCHVPKLPLSENGHVFTEPNPFNPTGNLRPGDTPTFSMNLNDRNLDQPRLYQARDGKTWVPAFTDLKLHDITSGPADPNREPINMHAPAGSPQFFAGNSRFLTRKLWGIANEPPFFHHGQFTTLREAIEAHHGEAEAANQAWHALSDHERGSIIEFLKTLQVLPAGTRWLVVDDKGHPKFGPRSRDKGNLAEIRPGPTR